MPEINPLSNQHFSGIGKFRVMTSPGKIKKMRVKMNKKSKKNESCMSDFLSSPFSPVVAGLAADFSAGENASLRVNKRDSLAGKLLGALYEKQFLLAGDCVFTEPVRRRGTSGSITKWQGIENSYQGLQKVDDTKLVSNFETVRKKN